MSWASDWLCTGRVVVVVGETVLDSTTGEEGLAVERGNASLPRLGVELKMDHELTTRHSPSHSLILCRQYHDDGRQQGESFSQYCVLRAARRVPVLIITCAVRRVRRQLYHDLLVVGYSIECLCLGRHFREEAGFHHLYVHRCAVCKGSRADRLRLVRDFDKNDAKAWWPISTLLVAVIYTGSKALVSLVEGSESQSMLINNPSNSCLSPSTRKMTDHFETLDRTDFICSIFKNLTIILIVGIIIDIQGAKANLFTGLRRSVHVQRFRHRSHSLLVRSYGEYFSKS